MEIFLYDDIYSDKMVKIPKLPNAKLFKYLKRYNKRILDDLNTIGTVYTLAVDRDKVDLLINKKHIYRIDGVYYRFTFKTQYLSKTGLNPDIRKVEIEIL